MKKFLTFILVLAMVLSVSSFAMAAEKPVSNQDELNTAIANAVDNDVIIINTAGTYKLPGFSNKTLTIKANVDGVIIDNNGAVALSGSKVTFEKITFDYYPNVNYTGLQHVDTVTYNNCTINGQVFLYGNSEIFNECTFNQSESNAYNVWTYSANVVFNDCKFNSNGKSILIYNEKNPNKDIEINDCEFVAKNPANDDKAAVEIHSNQDGKGSSFDVKITNSTASGFDNVGEVSGLVHDKSFDKNSDDTRKSDLTVDGNQLLPNAYVVEDANGNRTEYKDFDDALAAANSESGDATLTLYDDAELPATSSVNGNVTLNAKPGVEIKNNTGNDVAINGITVPTGESYTVPSSNPAPSPGTSEKPIVTPNPASSGSGISVKYNGGNSFSTSKSDVPTGVEIDGVPVTFNGTGSNFTVGCISSDAKWVTVRWNSTSVTTNFTPDGLVECATVSIPKTGDMSFWAAVAAFFGF